ncbi:hypothetical protein SMD11_6142 [Streptomyces albireticuli]|uniref:Uncharacterized protein n=1 Tax=Streptomyces albireticuli TaxID=1940 RepID=A0A1Z2LBX7_9ACTN|nr:hypothetical protein SMD11_6142 [Streptomyces albireticuli]
MPESKAADSALQSLEDLAAAILDTVFNALVHPRKLNRTWRSRLSLY